MSAATGALVDSRRGYQPALDGLRALSVLAVFGFHFAQDFLPGGYLGVAVFFVLSGYLITALLLREQRSAGRISLRRFYGRRLLRLYPALIALAVLGLAASAYRSELADGAGAALAAVTYTTNIALVTGFLPVADWSGHTWSLAVEEQFYLVWPVLLIVAIRRRWNLLAVTLGLLVVSAVARAMLVPSLARGTIYVMPIGHLDELMMGAVLAVLLHGSWGPAVLRACRPVALAGVAAAALAAAMLLSTTYDMRWLHYGGATALALATAVLVGHTLARPDSPITRLLSLRALAWLGRRSYGFYLYQQLVAALLEDAGWSLAARFVVGAAATLALTVASYRFVELPFLRRKRRLASADLEVPSR